MKKLLLTLLVSAGVIASATTVSANETGEPLYRLYNPHIKAHLYTKDTNEYKVLGTRGWNQEGVAYYTSNQKGDSVFRLYHSGLKVHLYTKDKNEYKVLSTRGWKQEGEAYKSSGSVPIYRLYHQGIKKHLYTKSLNEYTVLAGRGWRQEGIAFYALPDKKSTSSPSTPGKNKNTTKATTNTTKQVTKPAVKPSTKPTTQSTSKVNENQTKPQTQPTTTTTSSTAQTTVTTTTVVTEPKVEYNDKAAFIEKLQQEKLQKGYYANEDVVYTGQKEIEVHVPENGLPVRDWNQVNVYFIQFLNQLRQLNGSQPIQFSQEAFNYAKARSEEMANNDTLSHVTSLDYKQFGVSFPTENCITVNEYLTDIEFAYETLLHYYSDQANAFYSGKTLSVGNYGHRKTLLQPYVSLGAIYGVGGYSQMTLSADPNLTEEQLLPLASQDVTLGQGGKSEYWFNGQRTKFIERIVFKRVYDLK